MATSSDTSDQNNVKSRRPAESAFKQQRLPAWQPILTAGTVLPTFFVIGIAFIPVGIGLLYFSDEVKEHVEDYTQCMQKDSKITCADFIKQTNMTQTCQCELTFNLTEDFKADVYFYYGLSNYYQNHRRYVKSRDDNQLLGRLDMDPSTDCEPFSYAEVLDPASGSKVRRPIAPCGAIANSLFNDSLSLYTVDVSGNQLEVPVLRKGIAWTSDREIKFRNPPGDLKTAFQNYTKPSNWQREIWNLDPEDSDNNGFQNEDLIVWMRTAALPTFRKLYRRVNHDVDFFRKGLNKGTYILKVDYNYPVTDFDGTKSFIISTTSLLGGKNPFLGVAYVVVGTLCLLLGIVLLIIHVRCSKRYFPTPNDSFFWNIDANTRSTNMGPINENSVSSPEKPNTDTAPSENKPMVTTKPSFLQLPPKKSAGDKTQDESLAASSGTDQKQPAGAKLDKTIGTSTGSLQKQALDSEQKKTIAPKQIKTADAMQKETSDVKLCCAKEPAAAKREQPTSTMRKEPIASEPKETSDMMPEETDGLKSDKSTGQKTSKLQEMADTSRKEPTNSKQKEMVDAIRQKRRKSFDITRKESGRVNLEESAGTVRNKPIKEVTPDTTQKESADVKRDDVAGTLRKQ